MTQTDPHPTLAGIVEPLAGWLPEQRWFAGKGSGIRDVRAVRGCVLLDGDPQLLHAVVEVTDEKHRRDRYQLLLGARHELPEQLGHAVIAAVDSRAIYDATHDTELTGRLLELLAAAAPTDTLEFTTEPGVELDTTQRSRPVGAEQSNTSLVYGHTYILKLFRRLAGGRSPDLELHRALAKVGCAHIAAPLGAIEGTMDGELVTYAMLTEFIPNTADGWAMATASVRDLLAEDQAHPDEVGGDFASEAHRLGQAVATVHADLARALGDAPAGPEQLDQLAASMHRRLDAALAAVPELAAHEPRLREAFDQVRGGAEAVRLQRVHGDLHLGQVLRSVSGWILIDFEGEPAVELAERSSPTTPLRDVAGMLRSFDYAANHMLDDHQPAQQAAAAEWAARNRSAFCDGYAEVADDPRRHTTLLRAFELDKAVYEVAYEHHSRPGWLPIPLAAIARITAT